MRLACGVVHRCTAVSLLSVVMARNRRGGRDVLPRAVTPYLVLSHGEPALVSYIAFLVGWLDSIGEMEDEIEMI